jgi:hypothetical protein
MARIERDDFAVAATVGPTLDQGKRQPAMGEWSGRDSMQSRGDFSLRQRFGLRPADLLCFVGRRTGCAEGLLGVPSRRRHANGDQA